MRTLNTPTISFPLYDAHGNRMCSLSRSGTDYFTTDTVRYYGAWGDVRVGNTTGPSIWRYCASLGHVADDESGFVYMRARYYESISGRFVSQDPARHGGNWYTYCSNNPITRTDSSGTVDDGMVWGALLFLDVALFLVSWILFVGVSAQLDAQLSSALAQVERMRGVLSVYGADKNLISQLTVAQANLRRAQQSASLNRLGSAASKIAGYLGLIGAMELANELYDSSDGSIDGFAIFAKMMGWQD